MAQVSATVTLKKWGEHVGMVFPDPIAAAISLASGTQVEIDVFHQSLVVRKIDASSRLDELCSRITPQNLHTPVDWGSPQGSEAW